MKGIALDGFPSFPAHPDRWPTIGASDSFVLAQAPRTAHRATFTMPQTFYCRLNAPRATFGQDMTPDEMRLMQAHAAHWRGSELWPGVLAFGVVGDPAGVFGVAVVEAGDESRLRAVLDADPVIRAGTGFSWDVHPMPFGARP